MLQNETSESILPSCAAWKQCPMITWLISNVSRVSTVSILHVLIGAVCSSHETFHVQLESFSVYDRKPWIGIPSRSRLYVFFSVNIRFVRPDIWYYFSNVRQLVWNVRKFTRTFVHFLWSFYKVTSLYLRRMTSYIVEKTTTQL